MAWGQLVSFDIFLNADNETESFDIPCDDGGGIVDVWCPTGADSEAIPFYRSQVKNKLRYYFSHAASKRIGLHIGCSFCFWCIISHFVSRLGGNVARRTYR